MKIVTIPCVSDKEIDAVKSIIAKLDKISEDGNRDSIDCQFNGLHYVFKKQDGGFVVSKRI